ncbi:hypothetical protein [Streptacidiphilus cavernicola]|uniref:Uncharacterized protein n=1 Tax=Streptacidiphilus cavernicola TaxID=3342716 RepID=A0ABV6W6C3_9ACTN
MRGLVAALLGRMQAVERLLELVTDPDVTVGFLVDVQRLEERLVQPAALLVVTTPVERLWVFEQLQAQLDDLRRDAEILDGVAQPSSEALPLPGDLVQSSPDLGLGQGAICRQVDEVGLFGVERAELLGLVQVWVTGLVTRLGEPVWS